MGEQRLHHALAPIDLLTRLELEQTLDSRFDAFTRDFYRGKFFTEENGNAQGTATVTIPGPDSGYAWSIKTISINVLGTAQALVVVWLGDNTLTAPIGVQTTAGFAFSTANTNNAIFTFTSNVIIVKDQRPITVAAFLAGSAAQIGQWKVIAQQVPTEMEGKL